MRSDLKKALGYFAIASVGVLSIIIIDKLDFFARWLNHLEPYKNNLERFFYFCVLMYGLIRYGAQFKNIVKGFKVNAGEFGFEIDLSNEQCIERLKQEGAEPQTSSNIDIEDTKSIFCRGNEIEQKILSRLKVEMGLEFSENIVLKRGECRYIPDGFAVKNGRAYIVEIKVRDQSRMVDMAIQQLKTFSEMLPDKKLTDVTVILCLVSDHPVSYFRNQISAATLDLDVNFIFRVFTPKELSM